MDERRRRILVVDDDPEIRAILRGLLEGSGYAVETAASGRQVIEAFPEPSPDLMVLDLAMPDLDGWGVLERLQGRGRLPPVVLLSDRGEDPRKGRFRECILACLFKPLQPGAFLGTCRRVLDMAARAEDFIQDRRRDHRRPLIVEVTLLTAEGQPSIHGILIDLSRRGFQMELGVSLDPGTPLRALVPIPGAASLSLEGRVRWRQALPGGFLVGGDLLNVAPEKARLLESLLGATAP